MPSLSDGALVVDEEVFHGGRVAQTPDTLFGNRFSMLAAADERTVTQNDEVVPHEVVSAAPDMNVRGSHSRDGRRRLLLVSQDRFVMEDASDVVPTHLDQEVDATVVDPTMATVPDSFSESDTESLNSRPPDELEVEPEPVGLWMTPELRDALISLDVVNLQSVFKRRACVMKSCPKFLVGHYRAAMRFAGS